MQKTVVFQFSPGDRVTTALGVDGIVSMAAVDESGGIKYYVKAAANQDDWWTEDQLTAKA